MTDDKRDNQDPEYASDRSVGSRIFSGPLTGTRRERYTLARLLLSVIAIPTTLAVMVLLSAAGTAWKIVAGSVALAGVIASTLVWERDGNYFGLLIEEYKAAKARSKRRERELLDFAAKMRKQERSHE